jgi:Flp pilus assembly protein TadG
MSPTDCIYRAARVAVALIRRLMHDGNGVAGIEMAITMPVLLLLLCGGSEIALYARSHFQASQMASTVADAVSRYESLTASDVTSIFTVTSEIMGTDDFSKNGYVILSSVSRMGGATPVVAWQCKGGALASASKIGIVNKAATLPGNLTLDDTDNVIVAEVFYRHTPMFSNFVTIEPQLYKTAVFRPRLGSLTSAPGC